MTFINSKYILNAFFLSLCITVAAQTEVKITAIETITNEPFTYPVFLHGDNSVIAQKKVGTYLHLFRITSSGTEVRLTFDSADHKHAAISPDGKTIAYTKEQNQISDIFLLSLEHVTIKNLTNTTGSSEAHPSWKGDSVIIFNTNQYDTLQEISSINITTGKITRLTMNYDEDTYGSFSPDGKHLVYTKWLDGQKNAEIYLLLGDQKEFRVTNNEARDVAPVWISNETISYSRGGNIFLYNISAQTHIKLISDSSEYMLGRGVPAGNGRLLCEKIKDKKLAGLAIIYYNVK